MNQSKQLLIPQLRLRCIKEKPTRNTIRKWFKEVDPDDYTRSDRDEILEDLYKAVYEVS